MDEAQSDWREKTWKPAAFQTRFRSVQAEEIVDKLIEVDALLAACCLSLWMKIRHAERQRPGVRVCYADAACVIVLTLRLF